MIQNYFNKFNNCFFKPLKLALIIMGFNTTKEMIKAPIW